jgi:hypothetical protein
MSSMDRLNTYSIRKHAMAVNHRGLTLSVAEKDVGRGHVPTPVLVNSGNVGLRGFFIVERLITPLLLLRDREIRGFDVQRVVWVGNLVKPKLGTKLPGPRELRKTG